jgi:hypothetical protein
MKLKKINKKGILLSQGVRIILAILAVLFLIYLATQLTGIFAKRTALEQATASMKKLMLEVRAVENGDKTEAQLFIESPHKWWIIAWPYQDDIRKPRQCKKGYCLCICPIPNTLEGTGLPSPENSMILCNSLGVCEDISKTTRTMYVSAPKDFFSRLVKAAVSWFVDTKNMPLDISYPLPIRVKLVDGEIHVIK